MRYLKNILAFLFVTLFFVSCSNAVPEQIPEYDSNVSENSFDGLELVFAMSPYICYEEDSLFGDAARARVAEVEKALDVKITFDESDNITSNLMYAVSSGIKSCDVIYSTSYDLYGQMRANLLYPIDDFSEGIDYTDTENGAAERSLSHMRTMSIFTVFFRCIGPKPYISR